MSRKKVTALVAGWLAVASVGQAQTAPGAKPGAKLSPYYATASTVDRRGGEEASEMPPEMPNIPLPRASAPGRPTSAAFQGPPPMATPPAAAPAPGAYPAPTPGGHPGAYPPPAHGAYPAPAPGTHPAPGAYPAPGAHPAPAHGAYPAPGAPANGSCGPNGCGNAPCAPCAPACGPCGPNGPCGPDGRAWVSAEYLLWWTSGMNLPPLVTSSPAGTPRAAAGVLGDLRTRVLYGDDTVLDDVRSGLRVRAGLWLDECNTCGIEGSYFFLGRQTECETFICTPFTPIVARPFFNASTNLNDAQLVNVPAPDSELVYFPGVLNGAVSVNVSNDFWGFDANFRKNICCLCDRRVDFLAGYRYLRLDDSVEITEDLTSIDPNSTIPVGTRFLIQDRFETRNDFHGGQIGLAGELRRGRLFVTARGLVALGNSRKEATIFGSTLIAAPGAPPQQYVGGLLAQPTNVGTYTRNDFAVVPEGSVTVGYQLTDGVRAFVGYTFLYWSNVWRAGDQIDLVVNPTQIPPGVLVGAPRPLFPAQDTDFWAQGISFGVELRY